MARKSLLFVMFSLWIGGQLWSQTTKKEFDKLIFLYIDEKYEKCAKVGINYTENSDLRRDPIPYLYVSMSYFEIAKRPALSEKHPSAFKNALKYAYKYRAKDKAGTYLEKYEGFFKALKDSANRLGQHYYKTEDYRKAATIYKYTVKFDPDDPLMQVWQGICLIKSRNVGEGERNLGLAMERIDETFLPDKEVLWSASTAMEEYAAHMDSKGDYAGKRKGEKLAEKFKKYSPEEIERQKKLAEEANKPKREVKTFETSQEAVESQKKTIVGTNEQAKDAKSELKRIEDEQKGSKAKPKTFSSDDDDDEDDDW